MVRRALIAVIVCALLGPSVALADDGATISPATTDDNGFLVHEVVSPFQAGKTQIRVHLPTPLEPSRRYRVVYVLPVEANLEHRYGDGLVEIRLHELAAKHAAIFVAPSFSQLPWYADHPTDRAIRQESHFLQVVLPYVEKTYPVDSEPRGRLLLGFSKSAWGAWSMLLRHPDVFGRAAGWDGPLMMDRHGRYGSAANFGTQENFETYRLARLVREKAADLRASPRLILCGYSGFRPECQQMHALLHELRIAHIYRDGPERTHDWHSGWVSEVMALLLQP